MDSRHFKTLYCLKSCSYLLYVYFGVSQYILNISLQIFWPYANISFCFWLHSLRHPTTWLIMIMIFLSKSCFDDCMKSIQPTCHAHQCLPKHPFLCTCCTALGCFRYITHCPPFWLHISFIAHIIGPG